MYSRFTAPRILTPQEQKRLLRVVRAHASHRDGRYSLLPWERGLGSGSSVGSTSATSPRTGR